MNNYYVWFCTVVRNVYRAAKLCVVNMLKKGKPARIEIDEITEGILKNDSKCVMK